MAGLRIVMRGLRDTMEHLLTFLCATIGFWLGLVTVIFAPGALLGLFFVTDPRHGAESDLPSIRSTLRYVRANWGRSWLLGLATIPALALLFYNAVFYSRHSGVLNALTPLWIVLLALWLMISMASFSAGALLDRGVKASLRLGLLITGKALPRYAIVMILTGMLTFTASLLIVPLLLLLPATIAAIVNRLVLSELAITVLDPNAPTPELLAEQQLTGKPSRFGAFGLGRRRR